MLVDWQETKDRKIPPYTWILKLPKKIGKAKLAQGS
jgi:hypothetical protein